MKRKLLKSILCSLLIITLVVAPISALASSKTAYILKVTGSDKVNVRSGSSVKGGDSGIIGTVKPGTRVLYWGVKSGQMLKVMGANGQTGYIYQGNLKSYGAVKRSQVYLTKSATTTYKKSGSTLKKKGTVSANYPVVVYKVIGGYAQAKNISGTTVYIKTSALKKAF